MAPVWGAHVLSESLGATDLVMLGQFSDIWFHRGTETDAVETPSDFGLVYGARQFHFILKVDPSKVLFLDYEGIVTSFETTEAELIVYTTADLCHVLAWQ